VSVEIVYEVEDRSGTKGSTSIKVSGSPTVVQLNGFGVGYANVLNNIIAGAIRAAYALFKGDTTLLTGNTPAPEADVEHTGKFQFLTSGGTRVLINVPALSETTVGATDSDDLDYVDADVAAFLDAMIDGITVTGATIQPCDIGELDINSTVFSREAFRNSGKRR
jgi:hypothetical protein